MIPFGINSIDAWWTAYDLVQIAAKEIGEAEAYFSCKSIRPNVTRVSGASSPASFSRYVRVEGWEPVETRPTISAVTDVIKRLGGAELYGRDSLVPLRELIQNARDAIVAKRTIEGRTSTWGTITVSLTSDAGGDVLSVADNGVGMSERTMTNYLLDFGTSYWQSGDCLMEFPSLNFEQFSPVGEFGIGFFSVFMLGSKIKVTSRTSSDGLQQTRVLEFHNGLSTRPVLRLANHEEQLLESGTTVAVSLADKKAIDWILTPKREQIKPLMTNTKFRDRWTLTEALAWQCPACDVDIVVVEDGTEQRAVQANDWISMEPEQLFRRLFLHRKDVDRVLQTKRSQFHLETVEKLNDPDGRTLGRASLIDNLSQLRDSNGLYGIATSGPFRSSVQLLTPGIMLGKPTSASRNAAEPLAFEDHRVTSDWASLQANHAKNSKHFSDIEYLSGHAAYVRSLCGDMTELNVYLYCGKATSLKAIIQSGLKFDKVYLYPLNMFMHGGPIGGCETGNPSHIGVTMGRMTNGKLLKMDDPLARSSHPRWKQFWYSLWGAAIEAIAIAWQCDLTRLLQNATSVNSENDLLNEPAIFKRPG